MKQTRFVTLIAFIITLLCAGGASPAEAQLDTINAALYKVQGLPLGDIHLAHHDTTGMASIALGVWVKQEDGTYKMQAVVRDSTAVSHVPMLNGSGNAMVNSPLHGVSPLIVDSLTRFDRAVYSSADSIAADNVIDWAKGNVFYATVTGNRTFSFANLTSPGQLLTVRLRATGSYTVTWPATVSWPNGSAPAQTANKTDVYTFLRDPPGEGGTTTVYGSVQQNYAPATATGLAYDSASVATTVTQARNLNWTLYTTTSANRVFVQATSASPWNAFDTAKVDGANLTLVHDTLDANSVHLWLWTAEVSPASSHSIHLHIDDNTDMGGTAIAFSGSTGVGTGRATRGNSSTPSITVNSSSGSIAVASFLGATFAPDAGVTIRASVTDMGSSRKAYLCTKPAAEGSTTNVSGTQASGSWAAVGGTVQ